MRRIEERTKKRIQILKKLNEDKIATLQKGDELAPGVIKMVKIFVAMKESSRSATRWRGATATRASSRGSSRGRHALHSDGAVEVRSTPGRALANERRSDPGDSPRLGGLRSRLLDQDQWRAGGRGGRDRGGFRMLPRGAAEAVDTADDEAISSSAGVRRRHLRVSVTAPWSPTSGSASRPGLPASGKIQFGRQARRAVRTRDRRVHHLLKLSHLVDDKIREVDRPYSLICCAARRQGPVRRAAVRRDGGRASRPAAPRTSSRSS